MRIARAAHQGFTVLEVLVALTLLATTVLFATRAFLTVLKVASQSGSVTVATALATQKLEEIRGRVESKTDRTSWRTAFCTIGRDGSATGAFASPWTNYAYQVFINASAVQARSDQVSFLTPCWGIEWARTGCDPQPYTDSDVTTCQTLATLGANEDRIRWVTVEVRFRDRVLVRMTSVLIRGAFHRQ